MTNNGHATRSRRGKRRSRGRWTLLSAGVAAALAGVTILLVAPRHADASSGNTYVALGDSYSSGEGAPPYTISCDQSDQSWVSDFENDLGSSVGWTNDTCSGATS